MAALRRGWLSELAGPAALVALLGIWSLGSGLVRDVLRERTFDLLLPVVLVPRSTDPSVAISTDPSVAIVDIDRAALTAAGPWPWPRVRLARLIAAITAAGPAALAVDILFAGPDRFSAAALLDTLASEFGRPSTPAQIPDVPDGDRLLAEALAAAPAALGFALENDGTGQDLPPTSILLSGRITLPSIWQAAGVAGPSPAVAAGGRGFGALVTSADIDGPIRRVPLLVLAGDTLRPGLAVEAVRLAQGASALLIDSDGRLHVGAASVPLGGDAELRLVQRPPSAWFTCTVSAATLLSDAGAARLLAGRIVLVGSSAPELGGLRVTPASPATPSVQIQAEAIEALLRGSVAYRPGWLGPVEFAAAALLGLLGLIAARLRPLAAAGLAVAASLAWAAAAVAAVPGLSLLIDPAGPVLVALGSFAVAALTRFARNEWRARLLRASFEQHLAPDLVRRIVADPSAVRLKGELREVTALFTDIEGFTSMTERADPTELVMLLDAYFDAAARVVTDHGGMVEKFIGDAVHAIFNAPFALENHPARAVACSLALLESSESLRRTPLGQRLQLGRTRIGIETGPTIVGDVGGSRKLDYTAHGNAVNTAARLEAANKELGSSICIGPGTASALDPATVRQIGTLTLRGQSIPVNVFTPAILAPDRST